MANIEPQIKPNGLSQRNLVDVLFAVIYSIKGICAKLDLDDNTDATYEASVYTAIFNGNMENSLGSSLINQVTAKEDRFFVITPGGMSEGALLECLYQIFDMMETLTEQIDADDATTSTYEALIYTAVYLWIIENCKGSQLGNGSVYYFRPGGTFNQDQLVDLLYAIVYSLYLLTAKLDTDAKPAGADYADLWYTATILGRIENSKGSVVGNTPTWSP